MSEIDANTLNLIYQCASDAKKWPQLLHMMEQREVDITAYLPHLDSVSDILNQLSDSLKQPQASQVLEQLPIGIAIVDSQLNISQANPTFMSTARRNLKYFSITSQSMRVSHRDLGNRIRQCLTGKDQHSQHDTFMMSRDIPTSIMIMHHDRKHCTLLTSSQNAAQRLQSETLKQLFDLTPSESRLVKSLCNGAGSTSAAAGSTGISVNTARSQLKIIYQKVGVNSQMNLVKRVLTSVAVLQQQKLEIETNPSQIMFLSDGREISYREYGDSDGRPVLHLHSTGQSSRNFHPHLSALTGSGIRLISPDRPGTGCSSMKADYSLHDVANDLASFLHHLNIQHCLVIAFANGGSFAMALAHDYPDKISQVAIASAILPPSFGDNAGRNHLQRMMLRIAHAHPEVHRRLMTIALRNIEKNPETYMNSLRKILDKHDLTMDKIELIHAVTDSFQHALCRTLQGTIHDHWLSSQAWDFNPSNIQPRITFWHGKHNSLILPSNIQKLSHLLPHGAYHEVDGAHLIFYSHFEAMLDSLMS